MGEGLGQGAIRNKGKVTESCQGEGVVWTGKHRCEGTTGFLIVQHVWYRWPVGCETVVEGSGIKLRVSYSLGFHCLQHNAGLWCVLASVKCAWVEPADENTHVICVQVGKG